MKYEHCTALKPMELTESDFLNSWGHAEWQLVSVVPYQYQNQYYFKRELKEHPESKKEYQNPEI